MDVYYQFFAVLFSAEIRTVKSTTLGLLPKTSVGLKVKELSVPIHLHFRNIFWPIACTVGPFSTALWCGLIMAGSAMPSNLHHHDYETENGFWWRWWLFPHSLFPRPFILLLCFFSFFFKWRSACAHLFHSLCQNQSTVAERTETTVAENFRVGFYWNCACCDRDKIGHCF